LKLKNTELRDEFVKMTESELSDYKFLSKFIYDKVGLCLNVRSCGIEEHREMDCWGGVQNRQYPDELAKLLAFLYSHKDKINSYCEIGVYKGGTFFTIDSFLRAVNPNMGESIGVDIYDTILKHHFDEYQNKHSEAKFLLKNSLDFVPIRDYDFCFIDGNHSYEYIKHDYENMKNTAK